jgi:RNA polymerase sigma factor for flagellar operon FliA
MSGQTSFEATFVQNLALIERVAESVARRQGLTGDDAADLSSWIKLKLVESDYEVFRKFRGESSISTYLTVVIATLARDYRVQRWGRWRPSAAARRKGAVALRLEALVHRQGYDLRQAGELLRTAGETQLSDHELAKLLAQLPAREPLRPVEVGAEPLAWVPTLGGADARLENETRERERDQARDTLNRIMSDLPVEDRHILRMHFWEDMSVADIARGLHLEQKPLYRRLERLLASLRERLTQAGVKREQVGELINDVQP